ncbi:ParB/RepB/Spo0J family partition protein [Pseudonocardia sp. 73-21]|uniref:ParB/RepB/Spo0J family partition protein n=1 Tax=Pseudonocardia sp. 73-21 TaxID=1895809 RepID=UPI00262B8DB1|nr:ParB/RepB/Spo0J family partition protein [Pseudonocardia sp. 73-21]
MSMRAEQSQGALFDASPPARDRHQALRVQSIPVARIRAEDGLDRKRDREGHRELQRSIERFGVLTPITVRAADDGSDDFLLIKGQGRTLACQILGMEEVPAIIVDNTFATDEKVQQFLVENVARLRMRPVDRALLIAHARQDGEETSSVAGRFGVSAATVRRLEAQLDGATRREVSALRDGTVNLALHAVIARHVALEERSDIVAEIAKHSLRTKEVDELFKALGWRRLADLGPKYGVERLLLISWACNELAKMDSDDPAERLDLLAERLPLSFSASTPRTRAVTTP